MVLWSDDEVEAMRQLWEQNFSGSEIAERMPGRSRSAIIGKLKRDRDRGQKIAHTPKKRGGAKSRPASKPKPKLMNAPPLVPVVRFNPFDGGPSPLDAEPCSFLDLDKTRCHWPVGTPGVNGFHFCGGNAAPGRVYCAHHCRIAYTPATMRSRS